jgi:ribosomal-protein-alanine N-acetyltransferase
MRRDHRTGYDPDVPELQPLRPEHGAAVLEFERADRDYFARSISDRGDEFFEHFERHLEDALAEQAAGTSAYYLLVDENGVVLGRFNLFDLHDGTARLGYRVAESASGHGVATAAVEEMCVLAARVHDLHSLRAAVSSANVASQRVLLSNGFVTVGPADPSDIGGKTGSWYLRDLGSERRP